MNKNHSFIRFPLSFISPNFLKKTITTLAILGSATSVSAGPNQDFYISDAEPVELFQNTLDRGLDKSDSTEKYMSFSAYGQNFELVLQEKNELMSRFSSSLSNVELYAGKIRGNDNSWARITVIDGQYTGAIYDGEELYLLDAGENIADALGRASQNEMRDVQTAIYKASDASTNLTCGSEGSHKSAFSYENLLSDLQADQALAAAATEQVNVRIVADTQYVARSSNGAEAQVLSQMNIIDGIFSNQVGVQFGISEINVLTNNGSLTSTNASTLLNQFRSFTGNNNPGLSHLFTGREVDGNTIGIAFLRGICRSSGVGVTQAGGRGTLGALTAAHEFGHNFGAPHDNQRGSACSGTAGTFLMNPSLNGSDQFSQCSLGQISNTLAGVQCLVDVTPPTPTPTPTPAPSCNFAADFALGANNFAFVNDPQTPRYTTSSATGGAINASVGGVDNEVVSNIEGVWRRECLSNSGDDATISINASLAQSSEYESNEISQLALRVNGVTTVLNTLTGDGNGGTTQNTGIEQYSVDVSLNPGRNTIDLVCFNNQKTFANETTDCSFSLFSSSTESGGPEQVINTTFDNDTGGFTFRSDASDPTYSDGERSSNTGVNNSPALVTVLGGIDDSDISDMDALWTRNFNSSGNSLTLTLQANLVQSSEYEANESSQIGIVIDGQLRVLNTINGNGNGGGLVSTGFQTYTVPLNLTSGNHSISLYCSNNLKTFNNETTTCTFDNVLIE